LTRTTTVAERDPAWSPTENGSPFFSDESGEYALHLVDQSGLGEVRKIIWQSTFFLYGQTWSPTARKSLLPISA